MENGPDRVHNGRPVVSVITITSNFKLTLAVMAESGPPRGRKPIANKTCIFTTLL